MAYSLNTLDSDGGERFSLRRSVGRLIQETGLVLGLALIIFVLMALLTHSSQDAAFMTSGSGGPVRNWAGHAGALLSDLGFAVFGFSIWWCVIAGIRAWLGALARWMRLEPAQPSSGDMAGAGELERMLATRAGFWLALVVLMVASCTLEWSRLYRLDAHVPGGHAGGFLGHYAGQTAQNWFGFTGSGLLAIAGVVFGVAVVFGFSWASLAERIGRALETLVQARRIRREVAEDEAVGRRAVKERRDEVSPPAPQAQAVDGDAFERAAPAPARVIEPPIADAPKSERVVKERQKPLFKELPDSSLPQVSLLDDAPAHQDTVSPEVLEMTSRLIEKKLKDFGVDVEVVAAAPGPVITRYEIEPATGVKGSQIVNLAKDLARSLSLVSIRVVETIPGKNFMALELPNAKRQTIRLSEILGSQVYHEAKSLLTVGLGKDIVGNPVVADLAKMPHALVAGTTGSGKSVGINAMILSLLYKADPKDVRLLMIDPKMLEMSVYEGIPHLLAPVVTDMKQASHGLTWCVAEMERRYKLMSKVGVRNLAGFNQKVDEAKAKGEFIYNPFSLTPEDPEPLDRLPHIVVIIDELADLMMVVGKKIEELIARLAQKARAAGIHLLLATQRPSVDVITGLIKANIPTRIAFQVSSKIDSRTILDQMGAEALLGMGDMLYMPSGTSLPTRVHGAFVSDDEVHRVVEYLKTQGEPNYIEGVLEGGTVDGDDTSYPGGDGEGGEKDPMYDQAVEVVLKDRKASISYVQRKLRIGYNRSARLLEDMENAGVVSALGANGQRDILVPARSGE